MKYDIITATQLFTYNGLIFEVREKIKEGWRPLGAPFQNGDNWCQAMTLVETPKSFDFGPG